MATSRFLGMPSLVGEIFTGIIMGPNLLDWVPNEESFVMLGEIGYVHVNVQLYFDLKEG